MVLSSQQGRANAFARMHRRTPRRRRRANRGPFVLGGGVAILAALIAVLITGWPFGSSGAEPEGEGGTSPATPTAHQGGPDRRDSGTTGQQQRNRQDQQDQRASNQDSPDREQSRGGSASARGDAYEPVRFEPGGGDDRPADRRSSTLRELRDEFRPVLWLPRDIRAGTVRTATDPEIAQRMDQGLRQLERGQLVQARVNLSRLLAEEGQRLSPANAQRIRTSLLDASEILLFSRNDHPDDPLTETYRIQSGDVLERIARRYSTTPELIALINGMDSPDDVIRVGDYIKVIRGPLHVEVDMSAFRLDVLADCPASGVRVYIASFSVGVGKDGRETPAGSWVVSNKLKDPTWTDPDTGRQYRHGEEGHQIGSRWIALRGTDPNTEGRRGIGIHGTNEPESIGRAASRGCIRMNDRDVEFVYDLLSAGRGAAVPSEVVMRNPG